ncbi:hypothetical protein GCM10010129_83100 [Streptomyces fumigatiscleroticus]|nr:hypothetical protein GCM10010129_83100 [Streptomyces fumigatiscleroticus]
MSVAACPLTATWQSARLPSAPQYCRATPTEARPHLGNDTSSMTHTSGSTTCTSRSAIRRRTGVHGHGDWFTHCGRACMFPSGSRWAIGWIDLRRPSSISPRRWHSPLAR